MELASETRGKAMVVAPVGVVDHDTAQAFESKLQDKLRVAAESGLSLIIDMARLDYMSTVGLRVLMRASKRARELSVEIRVASMTACMREIFQISRFDKVIPVYDTVDAAVAG